MLRPRRFSHLNEAWAFVLVDRLHRGHGIRDFCIAPGSRSAPLVLALARHVQHHAELRLHTHFDERGLAFYALGLTKSGHRPVTVITTSGTAVANLHPAIIEAFETHCPLIALTADRPEELQDCGANQAIRQRGLFGGNLRGELRLPAPGPGWSAARLHWELDAALAGLHGSDAGPVHINAPFREPLYGAAEVEGRNHPPDAGTRRVEERSLIRHTDHTPAGSAQNANRFEAGASQVLHAWVSDLDDKPQPEPSRPPTAALPTLQGPLLLVAGHLEAEEAQAVLDLAQRYQMPVFADFGSQLRLVEHPCMPGAADLLLASPRGQQALGSVRQILQFGGRLTGKRLNQWLAEFPGERWLVSRHSARLDPAHRAVAVQCDIPELCRHLELPSPADLGLADVERELHTLVDDALAEEFSELAAARIVSEEIPPDMALMAGNSLSIRLLDLFARPGHGNPCVTHRGASGIDGLVASACGFARRHPTGVTLLLGDLSLLHDLNSLALAARSSVPLVIVLLNNDGGGIFHLLPARGQSTYFEPLFQLPHGLDFRQAAGQFGLRYAAPGSAPDFRAVYRDACARDGCTLIELRFPAGRSAELLQGLYQRLGDIQ
ncbi:2-succinyl-5-enolpyruvyl-6-hydroxy-3- cyclohexene-1-carboxylic-acid synthase [Thioalkalivibrio nitratireducens DSM 14787]|uniref:2-succinyl-5-enolpyruvyl-6-hydroxy-3-cyclohexene-1-carboxylate synthase n=1 Tax=Thioalkalivibrio nitratireducens (strain DSM 14787 / UNIQEM 213 / ALEN2) TaxID=1255043 RepID=L0DWG9_THIND|nr:2-succinyl-5-enolpyruvyl-6-hydroxy-3-cyclohexene-1-carboxylic-acid synthase [Thioalkalivibrio nitratireducens]AGA33325.1 2-succinyl-5-enolpyruvyl-6-hydroxy-3- cyclohexene-1-carboxylic-acid synthase [Thioalkalivibrio nitratireducens DSM 14787]